MSLQKNWFGLTANDMGQVITTRWTSVIYCWGGQNHGSRCIKVHGYIFTKSHWLIVGRNGNSCWFCICTTIGIGHSNCVRGSGSRCNCNSSRSLRWCSIPNITCTTTGSQSSIFTYTYSKISCNGSHWKWIHCKDFTFCVSTSISICHRYHIGCSSRWRNCNRGGSLYRIGIPCIARSSTGQQGGRFSNTYWIGTFYYGHWQWIHCYRSSSSCRTLVGIGDCYGVTGSRCRCNRNAGSCCIGTPQISTSSRCRKCGALAYAYRCNIGNGCCRQWIHRHNSGSGCSTTCTGSYGYCIRCCAGGRYSNTGRSCTGTPRVAADSGGR